MLNAAYSMEHAWQSPSGLPDELNAVSPNTELAARTETCKEAEVRSGQRPELQDRVADLQCQGDQPAATEMATAKEASTVAAMQAVFQTSELVENILVHLPAKTIFGVQRVSKSFNNAVKSSLPIKEKLFLRRSPEVGHKVIVYGFQHAAAVLNPIFIQGALPGDHTAHRTPLPSRNDLHEKYGVTMARDCVIPIESSVLDSYLLNAPLKKVQLSLRLWVGESSPIIMIDEVEIDAGSPMTIRAMIDSVLKHPQDIGLAFDEEGWRRCNAKCPRGDRRYDASNNGGWVVNSQFFTAYQAARRAVKAHQADRALLIPELFPGAYQVCRSLSAAKKAGREDTWHCETFVKPSAVLHDLQAFFGPAARVYVSLSQKPTFLLRDIVIPSPEHWAATEGRDE